MFATAHGVASTAALFTGFLTYGFGSLALLARYVHRHEHDHDDWNEDHHV